MLRRYVGDIEKLRYHELTFTTAHNSQEYIHRWPSMIMVMKFGINLQKTVFISGILL